MIDEYSIPTVVRNKIKERGYQVSTSMDSYIALWNNWYSGTDKWYEVPYVTPNGRRDSRKRYTLKPAKRACLEWASLELNEDTLITVDSESANEYLQDYLPRYNFWPTGQMLIEKAYALGTAAWALWFDFDIECEIKIRRYDARMIIPLSWDEEGISECAFVTRTSVKGKKCDQLQMHVKDGTYHIETYLFIDDKPVTHEDLIEDFDTQCETKTFGIIKPALENTVVDLSPYGMSIFHDAIDAIKSVDLAYDALFQEVELKEVRVFMDDTMIDVRDQKGKVVPVAKTPFERVFRKIRGNAAQDHIEVFSPDIRADALERAFNVALAEFGDLTGFGQQYFKLDKAGGMKTATEVSSDNSALMRNIKKHENVLRGAIQDIITALLTCSRIHCNAPIEEDFGPVSVKFDDSIITDTLADKTQMIAEINAGVVKKWQYAKEFYGMTEEEARLEFPDERWEY